jgi:cytochrome c oxidase cbb3-type subunit III
MLPSPRSLSGGLALVLAALWVASGFTARSQTSPQDIQQKNVKPVSRRGKQTFASTCAGCHGLDGRGGERAPNIAETPKVQQLSDAQISHIIENGVPGKGMPAFHLLENSDIKALVAYLRTLQGTKGMLKLPGDAVRGETIFFGKAGCAGCHMVAGNGGFIASDLSGYAQTHAPDQIRSAITAPGGDQQSRVVTATIRGGGEVVGRIRNEDNFSVQLQALDGAFHFVMKSDLEGLRYTAQPLMPSDYSSTLSSAALNDVVSYLMRVANVRVGEAKDHGQEFEDP